MPRPVRGVMAEILGGLALVMVAATVVQGAVLALHYEAQQRELLARALSAEAGAPGGSPGLVPGIVWWRVSPEGRAEARGLEPAPIDAESLALARAAREAGAPLLRAAPPWGQVRFALPTGSDGRVSVARLPASSLPGGGATSRGVALAILVIDAGIFIAFGASLLRKRVVLPLRRLAEAARAQADGAEGVRAPIDGARETAELGVAMNAMTESLAARSEELEKAVAELRRANVELREAEAGLARAARLSAVGRMAAGVAHEVGNPMGALLAFLDLVGRDPGLSETSRSHLGRCVAQVERVRAILRQMLDFSRPRSAERAPFDLGAVMEETAALLRAERGARPVTVETRRTPDAPLALGDPASAGQILLNLALNAADAVEGVPDPRISFTLRRGVRRSRHTDGGPGSGARSRRIADAVECVVEDNGPGIAAEDRERIFDPFFTTKPPGKGTGLGLGSALRLAEELGGTLELEPGERGARFVLRLAAAHPEADCGVRTELRSGSSSPAPAAREEFQD